MQLGITAGPDEVGDVFRDSDTQADTTGSNLEVIRLERDNNYLLNRGLAGLGLKLAWSEYGTHLPLPTKGLDFNQALKGNSSRKSGIGDNFLKRVQRYKWYIYEVKEDSPAYEAGLKVGDQIAQVDGKSLVGVTAKRAKDIWSETGKVVELEVARQVATFKSPYEKDLTLGLGAILVLVLFGIFLPTFDVYGDIGFIRVLFTGDYEDCRGNSLVELLNDPFYLHNITQHMIILRDANETVLADITNTYELTGFLNLPGYISEHRDTYQILGHLSVEELIKYPKAVWDLKSIRTDNITLFIHLSELITSLGAANRTTIHDLTEEITTLLNKHFNKHNLHPKFGTAMLAIVFLSFVVMSLQWYEEEDGWKQKLMTLPFLIMQFYPQLKALQVLYFAWKKDRRWKTIKGGLDSKISHVEPFIESSPQLFILWMFLLQTGLWKCNGFAVSKFFISCFAVIWGVFKLLYTGPWGSTTAKGAAFFAVIAMITATAKFSMFAFMDPDFYNGSSTEATIVIISFCFIPQFLNACLIIFLALGTRKGFSTILNYPALVLLPTFNSLTFGPVCKSGCIYRRGESKIHISWRHTWANMLFTLCGGVVASVVLEWYEQIYGLILCLVFTAYMSISIILLCCCQTMSCVHREYHALQSFTPMIQIPRHISSTWFQKKVYDTESPENNS